MDDLTHACTVNGRDAQYWYEQAEAWKAKAGSAGSDGEHRERHHWQKATGFEFASWYERAHPKTPPGPAPSGQPAGQEPAAGPGGHA